MKDNYNRVPICFCAAQQRISSRFES